MFKKISHWQVDICTFVVKISRMSIALSPVSQIINKLELSGSEAANIVADLEERLNIITHKLKFINEDQKPSVLVLSDVNPPVFERNEYLDDLIKIAGGRVYDSQITDGEKVFNPDVLLVVSDRMEAIFSDVAVILSLDEWKNTNAVKNNKVFLIDGQGLFLGYSANVAEEIEILAEILYPHYLTFGGNGDSWVQFEV